jgi:hypothetical protein
LDKRYVRHDIAEESASGLNAPDGAPIHEDHAARLRRGSIWQVLALALSVVIAVFSIYVLVRAVSAVSLTALR